MLDLLAGNALPLTGAHALGESIHAIEDLVHVGDDVLAVNDELAFLARRTAQRGVQDGAVLGGVDVLAGEHGVAALLELHLAGKIAQQLDGLIGHQVLGQIEVQVTGVKAQLVHALGIGGEPGLEVDTFGLELLLMSLERLPSGSRRSIDRCGNSCHKVLLSIRAHTSMHARIFRYLYSSAGQDCNQRALPIGPQTATDQKGTGLFWQVKRFTNQK